MEAIKDVCMYVCYLNLTKWTVISRDFAIRTATIKSHSTNTTAVIVGHPTPSSNTHPTEIYNKM
jgi:hypothetical protein